MTTPAWSDMAPATRPADYQPVALVDVLDRVLGTGVVISGDVTISIADVDLVRISLNALIASVGSLVPTPRISEAGEDTT